jgi:hypothetical protein
MEQFQCRRLINGVRCENHMTRENLGDAFDFPDCESCHERSKREDSEYGAKCDFGIIKSEIRCSEHDSNAVREVQ